MADVIFDFASHHLGIIAARVGEFLSSLGFLTQIEEKTGIPKEYIATAVTVLFIIILLYISGAFFVSYTIVVLYPAYQSFKCLEANDAEKIFKWIKYWIVFALFHGIENIGDRIIWFLPGYGLCKFLFLCWCIAPVPHNGSVIIYDNYIRNAFLQNSETVDRVIRVLQDTYNRISQ